MDITRKVLTISIQLLVIITLIKCGYSGDGKYEEEGIWPIKTYNLDLPEFALKSGEEKKFIIKGYYSHGSSWISLFVNSPTEIQFSELDIEIGVKVIDENRAVIFSKQSPLNAHYIRMVEEKETSWPLPKEWFTRYQYNDPKYDNSVVPYKDGVVPVSSRSAEYREKISTDDTNYTVIVSVGKVPIKYGNLTANISFSSGWK